MYSRTPLNRSVHECNKLKSASIAVIFLVTSSCIHPSIFYFFFHDSLFAQFFNISHSHFSLKSIVDLTLITPDWRWRNPNHSDNGEGTEIGLWQRDEGERVAERDIERGRREMSEKQIKRGRSEIFEGSEPETKI